MFLSAKAEYACLALLELAVRSGQPKPIRLSEITDRHNLKPAFLVQILLQLKGAGLVASLRGATGGYQLAKPPAEITLWDILTVVDRQESANDREITPSPLVGALNSVWKRIATAREDILRGTTLAELVPADVSADYVI